MRPAEVDLLIGDSTKAIRELGWKPKTNLKTGIKVFYNYVKNNINE